MQENNKNKGHIHPLSLVIADVSRIFSEMGFGIATGPEIETEFYNFDALNIPAGHPARDMWDTFWLKTSAKADDLPDHLAELNDLGIKDPEVKSEKLKVKSKKLLLRTHTSPVQIRYAEEHKPPIKIIAPGKTYRHEATDATHEAEFHQVEGLFIDKGVSMATLKGVLEEFFTKFFETKTNIRLRPSYFPFVEPGVEIDISCFKCAGKGCNICKQTGWIEVFGAGLVHPTVLNNMKIDSNKYSGFAFGGGIDRLAMLKYGINDVRLFYSGDLRLINQF